MEHESTLEAPERARTETDPPEVAPVGFEHRRLKESVRASLFGRAQDGGRIGRFTILRRLGAGGMGVVYSAYDDELERKVAIKLLRTDRRGEGAEARLRREAQAIARLSHPNVIGVFEVGRHGGALFVAMEFVRGQTLRQWLTGSPTAPEILDAYLQAAAGLAAAHEAGLIHRDFKPDNVMLGEDGRVRVLDFGLAAAAGEAVAPENRPPESGLDTKLTVTGTLMGTPGYMAPEQLEGLPANAASDQFSWCVSLWEALYGERPFEGDDMATRLESIEAGPPEPSGVELPSGIRQALRRGLARDPSDRWPCVDDLVHEVQRHLHRKSRRARVAGVGLLVASLGALAVVASTDEQCPDAEAKLEPVWNPKRTEAAREALARSGDVSLAQWSEISTQLDAYAAGWAREFEATCDDELSDTEQLERRLCLEQRLTEMTSFTDHLVAGRLDPSDPPLREASACSDTDQRRALALLESQKTAPAPEGAASGLVSDFEQDMSTAFGYGWQVSTDQIVGGNSVAKVSLADDGAGGSKHSMRIVGTVSPGGPALWSGAMFFPGDAPMAPSNLSSKKSVSFAARGTPGRYIVMFFTLRSGFEPHIGEFEVTERWQTVTRDLADFDPELYDVTGFFIGAGQPGSFELQIDDLRME
jgi:predicted Ser/Thr protein kinase